MERTEKIKAVNRELDAMTEAQLLALLELLSNSSKLKQNAPED